MAMYNPYNWTINKSYKKKEMKMPVYPGPMVFNCILDELGKVSNELEITRLEYARLKKDFEETEKQLIFLENKKDSLIKKMYD